MVQETIVKLLLFGNKITVTTIAKDEPYELKGDVSILTCICLAHRIHFLQQNLWELRLRSNWDIVLEQRKTWGYIPPRNHNNESEKL